MAISREVLEQIRILIRPTATRIANSIARGVVELVNDDKKLQLVQLGVLDGETVDAGEHHQAYGFSSVPLPGAEHVTLFPGGDRSHPLVVAVSDRRYRPTGGEAGEVTLYTDEGDQIKLGRGHVVTVTSDQIKLGSDAAAQASVLGNAFMTAMGTLVTAIATAVGASGTPAGATAAATAIGTALTTFQSAATGFLSQKIKLE